MKYTYIIGIDPGVNTGFAVVGAEEWIGTVDIIQAMELVKRYNQQGPTFVRIEDARLRKWFGKAGREVLQGVGSVKRDCSVWETFCTFWGIDFQMVHPKNSMTKLDKKTFENLTNYKLPTDQHGRDAFMLVWGHKS